MIQRVGKGFVVPIPIIIQFCCKNDPGFIATYYRQREEAAYDVLLPYLNAIEARRRLEVEAQKARTRTLGSYRTGAIVVESDSPAPEASE